VAENKKGFVLYADLIYTIEKMPIEKAGELFLHILNYVNDKNPVSEDLIINLTFEPIKQQLKRDLKKWEKTTTERSKSGHLGGIKSGEARKQKKANEANASNLKQNEANEAVNDTVKDTVIKHNIDSRKLKFADTLKPFVEKYGKEMIRAFYDYWVEPNKSNTKFRQELQKTWDLKRRLETWSSNNLNFKPKTQPQYNHDTNGLI